MSKIIMMKGLPGSGKTTIAKEMYTENTVRVNKDEIRMMMGTEWSKSNENIVLLARDSIIGGALEQGKNVVVDDTNFAPKHEERLRVLAEQFGADLVVHYVDTPVEECIKRDKLRQNPVGEDVIMNMYRQFVAPPTPTGDMPEDNKVIIVDIDGTLAHMDGKRNPYDYSKVEGDRCDEVIRDMVNRYYEDKVRVIIVSGRKNDCENETRNWLKDNGVKFDELHMRMRSDTREDSIVKREIFDMYIKPFYNVMFVLDDRNRVVRMWRDVGLKCLQVNEGNF